MDINWNEHSRFEVSRCWLYFAGKATRLLFWMCDEKEGIQRRRLSNSLLSLGTLGILALLRAACLTWENSFERSRAAWAA